VDRKVNLLYFSPTETTAKIVKAVAQGIGADFSVHDLTLPAGREKAAAYGQNDLVIVGVPVYGGRVPALAADYLANVKGDKTAAVFIAVYGNRHFDDALLELQTIMEGNGFTGIAAGAFIGEHSYTRKVAAGRPDESDLAIAGDFGTRIAAKLTALGSDLPAPTLAVEGKTPYKDGVKQMFIAPATSVVCTECGICADHCPTAAISFDNFKDIDAAKCILCCACIKICPVRAKSIKHPIIADITANLIAKCGSVRNEPRLFI